MRPDASSIAKSFLLSASAYSIDRSVATSAKRSSTRPNASPDPSNLHVALLTKAPKAYNSHLSGPPERDDHGCNQVRNCLARGRWSSCWRCAGCGWLRRREAQLAIDSQGDGGRARRGQVQLVSATECGEMHALCRAQSAARSWGRRRSVCSPARLQHDRAADHAGVQHVGLPCAWGAR
jgi:hypothetical protein